MIGETEQQQIMKRFEMGHRLNALISHPGWADLLDLWEAEVIKWENRLMNAPAGSETQLLMSLHAHARAARSTFDQMQLRVHALIQEGREATDAIQAPEWSNTNL